MDDQRKNNFLAAQSLYGNVKRPVNPKMKPKPEVKVRPTGDPRKKKIGFKVSGKF